MWIVFNVDCVICNLNVFYTSTNDKVHVKDLFCAKKISLVNYFAYRKRRSAHANLPIFYSNRRCLL